MRHLTSATRSLWRTPLASIASVLTLALAIGANTAIFSVVYGVLLRPLPFKDPSTLVQFSAVTEPDRHSTGFSAPELSDWTPLVDLDDGPFRFASHTSPYRGSE